MNADTAQETIPSTGGKGPKSSPGARFLPRSDSHFHTDVAWYVGNRRSYPDQPAFPPASRTFQALFNLIISGELLGAYAKTLPPLLPDWSSLQLPVSVSGLPWAFHASPNGLSIPFWWCFRPRRWLRLFRSSLWSMASGSPQRWSLWSCSLCPW